MSNPQMNGLATLALLLTACDPLAGSSYTGEPVASWTGSFSGQGAVAPRGLVILWKDGVGAGGSGVAATPLATDLQFPVGFVASVTRLPPIVARFRAAEGEPELGEGYVFAVTDLEPGLFAPRTVGADFGHALVWTAEDVAADTATAEYLGGPAAAGFALRRWVDTQALTPAQERLAARCAARATSEGEAERCRLVRHYRLEPEPEERLVIALF